VRRLWETILVALGFVTLSFAYFGWRLLPHPGNKVPEGASGVMIIWSFAWWEHAVSTFSNPFVTQAIDVPYGADIVW